jgi:abequosyltransferase
MLSSATLSICIPTIDRPEYISETLESIISQLSGEVEILIVDASTTRDTENIVRRYQRCHPNIHYYESDKKQEEPSNSGFDMDCNRAVELAQGKYCWLMTDDDLIKPGAIKRVLCEAVNNYELIVVNAEVMNMDFTRMILPIRMIMTQDKIFPQKGWEQFVGCTAKHLTFVGGVIIKRQLWLNRKKEQYLGTGFIHVGVIYQDVISGDILVIAKPLVTIRYGNALWSTRAFKIWMFDWPHLIWSLGTISDATKRQICSSVEPWRKVRQLLVMRTHGMYSHEEYRKYLEGRMTTVLQRITAKLVAMIPRAPLRILSVLYSEVKRLQLTYLLNRN